MALATDPEASLLMKIREAKAAALESGLKSPAAVEEDEELVKPVAKGKGGKKAAGSIFDLLDEGDVGEGDDDEGGGGGLLVSI